MTIQDNQSDKASTDMLTIPIANPSNGTYGIDSWTEYVCFGSLAVVTNCFVLFVLVKNVKLLKKSPFLFGLAIGDILDGCALLLIGSIRIARTLDGTYNLSVHPTYCMTIFVTPIFLLGNQIPGTMFFLVGIERFLAVAKFDWYYTKWTNTLAWLITGLAFVCCAISLTVAYIVVFTMDDGYMTTVICPTGLVVGSGYSIYNYGVSIVGGLVAAIGTALAMFHFTKRKNMVMAAVPALSVSVKNRVTRQWHLTRTMLCLAFLDLGLVVVPNLLVLLYNGFKVLILSSVLVWSLQIVCLRSSLNVFIYLLINIEFRQALITALFGQNNQTSMTPSYLREVSQSGRRQNTAF